MSELQGFDHQVDETGTVQVKYNENNKCSS